MSKSLSCSLFLFCAKLSDGMSGIPTPTIQRSFRNSISLHITRDGEIVVRAPHLIPNSVINAFLKQKESWILATLQKVHKRQPRGKKYKEGERFYYLGLERSLRFYNGTEIKVEEEELLFPKALEFRIQKELHQWFQEKAREKIMQRLEFHSQKMQTSYSHLLFSDTKSKWGTCFPDNSLQFNWRLIMAPLLVLDYVIIHELAHTTEKNHSASFWRRVGRFTPAYKQHRKWLQEYGHVLQV